jgi:hypothetical protein
MEDLSEFELKVKFKTDVITLDVTPETSVEDLRFKLFEKTQVLPKRQKILGSKKKLVDDSTLGECGLTKKSKLQLIGTVVFCFLFFFFLFEKLFLLAGEQYFSVRCCTRDGR